ncbi:hypothetical protein J2853_002304 [Streptosporangium lutulentum]|uniref:Uncharacterized protein n=1 Tax=Streptosporangium lutulentum TaxID=1461250 RepID=A0ABT9Q9U7_9ACTN|nr:hypothetical protein [Streptosporangium lutulentum]
MLMSAGAGGVRQAVTVLAFQRVRLMTGAGEWKVT